MKKEQQIFRLRFGWLAVGVVFAFMAGCAREHNPKDSDTEHPAKAAPRELVAGRHPLGLDPSVEKKRRARYRGTKPTPPIPSKQPIMWAGSLQPELRILMRLDGIEGDVELPNYEGAVEIERVQHSLTGAALLNETSAERHGRTVDPIKVRKLVDRTSPFFTTALLTGETIDALTISYVDVDVRQTEPYAFYEIEMQGVVVGQIDSFTDPESVEPIEVLSFLPQTVRWVYEGETGTQEATWDARESETTSADDPVTPAYDVRTPQASLRRIPSSGEATQRLSKKDRAIMQKAALAKTETMLGSEKITEAILRHPNKDSVVLLVADRVSVSYAGPEQDTDRSTDSEDARSEEDPFEQELEQAHREREEERARRRDEGARNRPDRKRGGGLENDRRTQQDLEELVQGGDTNLEEYAAVFQGAGYSLEQAYLWIKEQFKHVNDADLLAVLFSVFRESIQESDEDKKFFLEKLEQFNLLGEALAEYLRELKVPLADAVEFLKKVHGYGAEQAADALAAGGYRAQEIAVWLKDRAHWSATRAGDYLKGTTTWTLDQVANLLMTIKYPLGEVAVWLKEKAGMSVSQIAKWLKAATNLTFEQVASLLVELGFSPLEVAEAMPEAFPNSAELLLAWLELQIKDPNNAAPETHYELMKAAIRVKKALGASASEIGDWLVDTFQASWERAADLLAHAGYSAANVAAWLREKADWSAAQVGDWLVSKAQKTWEQTADVLVDVGFSVKKVIAWLKEKTDWTLMRIVEWLKNKAMTTGSKVAEWLTELGYSTYDIAEALYSAYGASAVDVAFWLLEAGNPVGAIMQAVTTIYDLTIWASSQLQSDLLMRLNETNQ